jgi:hypothetical protein
MKLADCASLPGFTVQEAKNKIKNLRSTYSQELKKVKQSKKSCSDEVYQPSLIWYKEIDAFLGPVIASRDTQTSIVSCNITAAGNSLLSSVYGEWAVLFT